MQKESSVEAPLRNSNVLKFQRGVSKEEKEELIGGEKNLNSPFTNEEFTPPPWVFQHQDLNNVLESAKMIDEKSLKNKLNHAHFMDGNLLILLRHLKYGDNVIVKVKSGPCLGSELTCQFCD